MEEIRQALKSAKRPLLLVLVVLVLVVILIVVYIFRPDSNKNNTGNSSKTQKSNSLISSDKDLQNIQGKDAPGGLSLDTAKVSSGWTTKVNTPRHVNLVTNTSPQSTCFVDVSSFNYPTTDPAYIAGVKNNFKDYYSSNNTHLQSTGYAVTMLPDSTVTITTNHGKKQLGTKEIKAVGPKNGFNESDVITINDKYYLIVKAACADHANMQAAKNLVTSAVIVTD